MKQLLLLFCAVGLIAGLLVLARQADSSPAPAGPPSTPAVKVHVDPKTGRLGSPPAGTPRATQPTPPAINTSHAGLVEEPGRGPGGGFIVDLQGRFQSHATVRVGTNGALTTRCEEPGVKQ